MEWFDSTVGEFCPFIYGKAIKKQNQLDNGMPVFGSNGVYTYSETALVEPYAVIVGRKGTVGKVHLSLEPCWVSDTAFYIPFESEDEARFTYYLLSTLGLEGMNTDAAVPGLNRNNAHRLEITVPKTPEERMLLTKPLMLLDKKIELNRQINQTLEEMAQAIFKSWFVDFDPVKAKVTVLENGGTQAEAELAAMSVISGKSPQQLEAIQAEHPDQYKQLHKTASLFPSTMQDSELGEIPDGWEIKSLGDCEFEIESGKRPKGGIDKSLLSGVPSVGAESIAPVGQFNFGNVKYITEEFAGKAKKGWVQNYDVALYKDGGQPGLFKPRVALYGNQFPYESFLVNEHVFLLRSQDLGQPFLYHLISSQGLLDQLIAKGSAKAAQPGLNQTEVKTSRFVCADSQVLDAFNKMIKPMLDKQLLNGKESQTLAELRDTLLPKLLSGELQLSNEDAA
jgi:type I restriction enzyme S subunit